ncbi:MAG: DUF4097 family beta strand repeat-containing protein [Gemmatimonadales bacterium]
MRMVCCLVFLSLTAGALSAQQAERYAIDGDDVAIYNLAGQVRLEAGQNTVAVSVTRGGTEAARLKVAQDDIGGRPTLRILYPGDQVHYATDGGNHSSDLRVRDDGTFGDSDDGDHHRGRDDSHRGRRVTISSRGGGLDAHADLRIQVPAGRRVSMYLAVGKVTVANVSGDLYIDASSAPVAATRFKGTLRIDVGSGLVEVSQVEGRLSVDTGSGDVTGADIRGDELSVDTGSGDIRLSGVHAPKISLETGSGAVTADLRADVGELSVETGSGDIAITAPPTLGAEVEIETSSGDIETDFPLQVTRSGHDHVKGRIGDGKGTIAIETGSGGIKLLRRSN